MLTLTGGYCKPGRMREFHVKPAQRVASEKRCVKCGLVLIRHVRKDKCPDCQSPGERDDEETILRARLQHPWVWDALVAQDRRALEFARRSR